MNNCQGATTKYEKEKNYREKGQMHCLHIYSWRYKSYLRIGVMGSNIVRTPQNKEYKSINFS